MPLHRYEAVRRNDPHPGRRRSARPRKMFSGTESAGTRASSWEIIATPARWASSGRANLTCAPPILISPRCPQTSPERIFIRVDFPAPFSPSSAWTSPGPPVTSTLRGLDPTVGLADADHFRQRSRNLVHPRPSPAAVQTPWSSSPPSENDFSNNVRVTGVACQEVSGGVWSGITGHAQSH